MTTATPAIPLVAPTRRRDAVVSLARTETRRALRGPAFWIGALVTAWFGIESRGLDWQGGLYSWLLIGFAPMAAGIFVAGVLAGGRDRRADGRPALADEAALDDSDRAVARMLGLLPLVLIGSLIVVAFAIGIRIEGGQWIGDEPGRTDTAVHGIAELLQPILLFAVAATIGVAAGRTFRRRVPVVIVGLFLAFLFTSMYWAWQWAPAVYVIPTQVQPIELTIDGATDPAEFPDDWLLVDPDDPGAEWRRTLVHTPLAAWHAVYLAGLVAIGAGVAIRHRSGQRIALLGIVVAGTGVVAQYLVTPDNMAALLVPL